MYEFDYEWMDGATPEEIRAELSEVERTKQDYIDEGWIGVDEYIAAMKFELERRG